jgi:hypothetical protein
VKDIVKENYGDLQKFGAHNVAGVFLWPFFTWTMLPYVVLSCQRAYLVITIFQIKKNHELDPTQC